MFAVIEIALAVLTCTKWCEKSKWLKNRAVVTIAEFALLLLMVVLPTTYMKWRFACALAVLFIRLAIAGISFLAKRKSVTGTKKKAGRIVSCVLSIVLITLALMPSFMFSNYNGLDVTGDYEISECSSVIVDNSRVDEFENDGSNREVALHFYYPEAEGEFPLVVFSHGAFGYYQSNYSTYAELASNGYIVVALDHPHHAFFTTDSNGKTVIVDTDFFSTAMRFSNAEAMSAEEAFETSEKWMELRTDDGNFVLDTIKRAKAENSLDDIWATEDEDKILSVLSNTDTNNIGYMGHSMGGATAVALGRERDDLKAVICLDGSMLSEMTGVNNGIFEYENEPYPIPVLDFRKECDYNEIEQFKNDGANLQSYPCGIAYVNNYVIDNALNSKSVMFNNAGHMDFTDLPMFSPFLGGMLGSEADDCEEFMTTVNGIVLDWFDYYLKNEGTLDIKAEY